MFRFGLGYDSHHVAHGSGERRFVRYVHALVRQLGVYDLLSNGLHPLIHVYEIDAYELCVWETFRKVVIVVRIFIPKKL